MADFYDTNDAHQKLGRRIAETLLWEVYDRMISMYSLTPVSYTHLRNLPSISLRISFVPLCFSKSSNPLKTVRYSFNVPLSLIHISNFDK